MCWAPTMLCNICVRFYGINALAGLVHYVRIRAFNKTPMATLYGAWYIICINTSLRNLQWLRYAYAIVVIWNFFTNYYGLLTRYVISLLKTI